MRIRKQSNKTSFRRYLFKPQTLDRNLIVPTERQQQLLPSSLGTLDATSKFFFFSTMANRITTTQTQRKGGKCGICLGCSSDLVLGLVLTGIRLNGLLGYLIPFFMSEFLRAFNAPKRPSNLKRLKSWGFKKCLWTLKLELSGFPDCRLCRSRWRPRWKWRRMAVCTHPWTCLWIFKSHEIYTKVVCEMAICHTSMWLGDSWHFAPRSHLS